MDVAEAVSAPRIHHQWSPDRVIAEQGLPNSAGDAFLIISQNQFASVITASASSAASTTLSGSGSSDCTTSVLSVSSHGAGERHDGRERSPAPPNTSCCGLSSRLKIQPEQDRQPVDRRHHRHRRDRHRHVEEHLREEHQEAGEREPLRGLAVDRPDVLPLPGPQQHAVANTARRRDIRDEPAGEADAERPGSSNPMRTSTGLKPIAGRRQSSENV